MKILHVVRQFYPMIGGLENYVYHLAHYQLRQGHEVAVVSLDKNFLTGDKLAEKETLPSGLQIIRIPYYGIKKYPLAPKVLRVLHDYELVNVHAVDFFADFLAFTKFIHRKKLVLTTHGGFFHTSWGNSFKRIYFNTITRISLRAYETIIGCSENDVRIFRKITGRIQKVDNGVDVSDLLKTKKKRKRGELMYVGRIDVHKKVDRLIDLTAILHRMGNDVRLNVLGPDWKKLVPGLTKKAEGLGIADRVIFHGAVNNDELRESFQKADVFLSASEYEGFGISAVEAMASGTLCVLNDIESFRKLLDSKKFGSISDFRDPEKTAREVGKYLNLDDDEYLRLSDEARDFSKNYDWEYVSRIITEMY